MAGPAKGRFGRAIILRAALPCLALIALDGTSARAQTVTPDLFSPDGFTAGELLHKLHAELAPKLKNRDHHFFEGLYGLTQPDGMPPGYFVSLGS